jgi:hypothetical protein
MSGLNKGKHLVIEIDNVTCSIVETGLEKERLDFLKSLLELNGYEVKTLTEEPKEGNPIPAYTLGVTDILFNPVIDVYKRGLRSKSGHRVTPAYWLQKSVAESEAEVNYWNLRY